MRFGLLLEITLPVVIVLFVAITMHGMVVSETGYGALAQLNERRVQVEQDVAGLRARRIWMENRAALMNSADLDPDMVDERIRDVLGYAAPGDIVISRKDLHQAVALIKARSKDRGNRGRTEGRALDSPVGDGLAAHQATPVAGIQATPVARIIATAM